MCRRLYFLGSLIVVTALVSTSSATINLDADYGTITVDGDLSDWAGLASTVQYQVSEEPGAPLPNNMQHSIAYAWDDANLYVLAEETAVDDDPYEGGDSEGWLGAPWFTDSVGLYNTPIAPSNDSTAPKEFDIWIGYASDGEGRMGSRYVKNETPLQDFRSRATPGVHGDGRRYVEAYIPWAAFTDDLAVAGYAFISDPLLVDGLEAGHYDGQSFPGGVNVPWSVPEDGHTVVTLVPEPTTLVLLGLCSLFLRRRVIGRR